MKSPIRLTLCCGQCGALYRDRVATLRNGADTICTVCGNTVRLDAEDAIHAPILARARALRQDRRTRLADLRAGWVTPALSIHGPAAPLPTGRRFNLLQDHASLT